MATSQKMPKKSSLLTRFAKTAGKTVVGIALAYTGYIGAFYTGRGEPLTKGETQLVQSIFGDQLDASKLRKHFKDAGDFTHVMRSKRGTVMPFTNPMPASHSAAGISTLSGLKYITMRST